MLQADLITFETTDFDYSGSFNKDTEALTAYMRHLHQFFDRNTYVKCAWVSVFLEGNDVDDMFDHTKDQFSFWRYMNLEQRYELYLIKNPQNHLMSTHQIQKQIVLN